MSIVLLVAHLGLWVERSAPLNQLLRFGLIGYTEMDLLPWPLKLADGQQQITFNWPSWSDQQHQQYARDLAFLEAAALQYYWNPAALAQWVSSSVLTTETIPNHIKRQRHQLSFGIDRILGDQVGTAQEQGTLLSNEAQKERAPPEEVKPKQQEQNQSATGESSSRRKRSWSRAVFSNLQRKGLEKRFQLQKYITKPDRRQLAATLGLTDAQVKVWFQNRRMKWRHTKERQSDIVALPSPSDPLLDYNLDDEAIILK